jgi:ankyrin repeat protein
MSLFTGIFKKFIARPISWLGRYIWSFYQYWPEELLVNPWGPQAMLIEAIRNGNIALMRESLSLGANINKKVMWRHLPPQPPLHFAYSLKMVRAVLDAGANIEGTNVQGKTILFLSSPEIIQELISRNANLDHQDDEKKTALHCTWCLETVRLLLRSGANPNIQDEEGNTPLNRPILHGDAAVIDALINAGGDVNIPNKRGNTPLHSHWNPQIIARLIQAGAKLNARNTHQQTPAHLLAIDSSISTDSLNKLLAAGAEVDVQDDQGNTPLHEAVCREGYCLRPYRKTTALLNRGANPSIENHAHQTPWHIIQSRQNSYGYQTTAEVSGLMQRNIGTGRRKKVR